MSDAPDRATTATSGCSRPLIAIHVSGTASAPANDSPSARSAAWFCRPSSATKASPYPQTAIVPQSRWTESELKIATRPAKIAQMPKIAASRRRGIAAGDCHPAPSRTRPIIP